jgi:serine-protein kinase ATM
MTGIEGVFRKCSEETLRVLREQSSVILTILDVLKYDPLQKW